MKKLLLIITALAFIGCSDDVNETLIEDNVVGTWHCYKTIITTPDGEIDQSINEDCPEDMPTIKFNSNSTGSVYVNDGNCNITGQEGFDWEPLEGNDYLISAVEGELIYTMDIEESEMELIIDGNTSLKSYFYKVD